MGDILRGNTSLSKIYRGQTELSKVYRGQTEIWSSAVGPSIPIPTTNLVAFWDGTAYSGTGDWIDSYGGYDLTAEGNVSYNATEQAFEFPGASGDYMSSTSSNPLTGTQNRTLIAYVYHNGSDVSDNSYMYLGRNATGLKYTFRIDSGTDYFRTEIDGAYSLNSSGRTVSLNTWTFAATVLNGTQMNHTYFGHADESNTTVDFQTGNANNSNTLNTASDYIAVGVNNLATTPTQFMEGYIKFIAMYDTNLGQTELQDIYDTLSAL